MVELVWDGKYDAEGRRTAPLRIKLPFQTVETVNESAQERQMALDLFSAGRPPEWRNRLIWGDKKYVLPALLDEFAGQVDLVYIDPPFATGADFSFLVERVSPIFHRLSSSTVGDDNTIPSLRNVLVSIARLVENGKLCYSQLSYPKATQPCWWWRATPGWWVTSRAWAGLISGLISGAGARYK
jgi:hypothetical protein